MGFSMGPGGATATLPSPYELALTQANIAKSGAETEESRARTAGQYGQTAEAAAKIAQEQAATERARMETGLLGTNQFTLRHNQAANNAAKSGYITSDQSDQSDQSSGQPDVNINF
jgi:multidrug resistance efflux pump